MNTFTILIVTTSLSLAACSKISNPSNGDQGDANEAATYSADSDTNSDATLIHDVGVRDTAVTVQDVPPVHVGNCDGLGPVGTWQNVTPPVVFQHHTYTGALVPLVSAQNPAIVYVATDGDGVFRSTDCGATWIKANTGRHAADLDSGRIWAAVIDPIDGDTIYAITGYGAGGLWKTTNGGTDWDQALQTGSEVATTAGGFVERAVIDPSNHLHVIINFHQNCSAPHTPVCFGESDDGGATWRILDFPSSLSAGWGEGSGVMILQPDVWLYEQWNLFYTSDHGVTWSQVSGVDGSTPCFNGNTSTPPRTTDGSYFLGASPGILKSSDGMNWAQVPNSGHGICPVIGDGERLFAGTGNGADVQIMSATYADPNTWSTFSTTGLTPPAVDNTSVYCFADDTSHHLLYMTIQQAGVWRMVTR